MLGGDADASQIATRCSSFDSSRSVDPVCGLPERQNAITVLQSTSGLPQPKVTTEQPTAGTGRDLEAVSARLCMCGHPYTAHQHYRRGKECSLCPDCRRWRRDLGWIMRIVKG
jgi:hypothetical protein